MLSFWLVSSLRSQSRSSSRQRSPLSSLARCSDDLVVSRNCLVRACTAVRDGATLHNIIHDIVIVGSPRRNLDSWRHTSMRNDVICADRKFASRSSYEYSDSRSYSTCTSNNIALHVASIALNENTVPSGSVDKVRVDTITSSCIACCIHNAPGKNAVSVLTNISSY